MNERLFYLQAPGLFQSEWSAVLFLLMIGTLYFLAPAVGYRVDKRGGLAVALWVMVAKLAIGVFRQNLFDVELLSSIGPPTPAFVRSHGGLYNVFEEQLPTLLMLAETVAFLAAIILFVYGLQRLVRCESRPLQVPQGPER